MMPLLFMAAMAASFRADGSGHWPDATMPSLASPTWSTATETWGNASVVVTKALACATIEPTTLVCYDRTTGQERWRARNDYLDTLSGEERATWKAKLDQAPVLQGKLTAAKAEVSRLRREMRREGSGVTATDLEAASASLDALRTQFDLLQPYLTPADKDVIGYTSASPLTDGTRIFVQFGNGVLSAFAPDGTRVWSRWLGAPIAPMNGYDFGSTASPVWLDGDLLTAHGTLRRIDPATGTDRWTDDRRYLHFGSPALAKAGGRTWIATPGGRVLDASTGRTAAETDVKLWYAGPTAKDDVVYWVGGRGNANDPANASAKAVRLVPEGAGVRLETLFHKPFPVAARVYMAPIVWGDELYSVTANGTLAVFDRHDGTTVSTLELPDIRGDVYQGVQRVGELLMVADDRGHLVAIRPGRTPTQHQSWSLGEENRTSPTFYDGHMFVRTISGIRCY